VQATLIYICAVASAPSSRLERRTFPRALLHLTLYGSFITPAAAVRTWLPFFVMVRVAHQGVSHVTRHTSHVTRHTSHVTLRMQMATLRPCRPLCMNLLHSAVCDHDAAAAAATAAAAAAATAAAAAAAAAGHPASAKRI